MESNKKIVVTICEKEPDLGQNCFLAGDFQKFFFFSKNFFSSEDKRIQRSNETKPRVNFFLSEFT